MGELQAYLPSDLERLNGFINLVQGATESPRASDVAFLGDCLGQPGWNIEDNCQLLIEAESLAGYVHVVPELPIGRIVIDAAVHPDFRRRGFGRRLLAWGLGRGRELGVDLAHVGVGEDAYAASALLEGQGFAPHRLYWELHWEGSMPEYSLPSGTSLRSFRTGDESLLAEVQNAAFDGQWGYSPNSVEDVEYKVQMHRVSHSGILFLVAGMETAGFCWTRIDGPPGNQIGVIWMIGVRPEFRRGGMGRAILLAGMGYLIQQGVQAVELSVDGDNEPAREMYLGLGFRKVGGTLWYERGLQNP